MDYQLFQVFRLSKKIKVAKLHLLSWAQRKTLLQIADIWNSCDEKFDHYWQWHVNVYPCYEPVPEGEIIPIYPRIIDEKLDWPPLTFFPGYSGFQAPTINNRTIPQVVSESRIKFQKLTNSSWSQRPSHKRSASVSLQPIPQALSESRITLSLICFCRFKNPLHIFT